VYTEVEQALGQIEGLDFEPPLHRRAGKDELMHGVA
jgi:hypothetical protein